MTIRRCDKYSLLLLAPLLLLVACGGERATEADRKALIGIWVPAEKFKPGFSLVKDGLVVIHADGNFDFQEREGYIARRSWTLTSKTTLQLVSGNDVKTSCSVKLEGSTLTFNDGQTPCSASELDPLRKMKLKFVKTIDVQPGG